MRFLLTLCLTSLIALSGAAKAAKDTKEPAIQFHKKKIKIGKTTLLNVEVADTPEKQARGLMFRQKMDGNHGMLFIFDESSSRHFWMKNTFIPLTIGFFDENRKLFDIQDMEPVKSEVETPLTYDSRGPAQFCLEVNRGWFAKNKIKIGDSFEDLP